MLRPTRKTMLIALLAVLGICIFGAAILGLYVEDWNRDLTTNVAATDPNSSDEQVHPILTRYEPEAVATMVESRLTKLPGWIFAEKRIDGAGKVELHFVRTTPVLRFKDDIEIRIVPHAKGSELSAESRSRVGRGDLGQNPRNLREMLDAIRDVLQ